MCGQRDIVANEQVSSGFECSIGNVRAFYAKTPNPAKQKLVIPHAMPLVVLLGSAFIWAYYSPNNALVNCPHLLLAGTGFYFAYLVV
mgnify:CR=1 FL=1